MINRLINKFRNTYKTELNTFFSGDPHTVIEIDQERQHLTIPPKNIIEIRKIWQPKPWTQNYFSYKCSLHRFENVILFSNGIFAAENALIKTSFLFPEDISPSEFSKNSQLQINSKQKILSDKTYLSITHKWTNNYYHWLIDDLPRLCAVKDWIKLNNAILIIPANSPSFIKESCTRIGVDTFLQKSEEKLFIKTLHHIPLLSPSGLCHPHVALLGDFLRVSKTKNRFRKIYISRKNSRIRHLRNEQEIKPLLEEFGFETIYAEEINFSDQLSLFEDVSVILGPHGAGLANAAFLTPGCILIEIASMHIEDNPVCFWTLAVQKKIDYYYIPSNLSKDGCFTLNDDQKKYLEKILKEVIF